MTPQPAKAPTTALVKDSYVEEAESLGYNAAKWYTLTQSLYPGANPQSVLMVLHYCIARKLDPLKKPCHIVQKYVKDARTGEKSWRDVVLPGIYEYRTTAMRTGLYLGHSEPRFGDPIDVGTKEHSVTAPEWCEMTFRRALSRDNLAVVIEFPVRVWFNEVVGLTRDEVPNERWTKAPRQMLTKCCEAAGLREAFPDELGGEPTVEEMEGQDERTAAIDADGPRTAVPPRSATRRSAKMVAAPEATLPLAEATEGEVVPAAVAVPEPLPVKPTEAAEPTPVEPEPARELTIAEALACDPVGTVQAVDVVRGENCIAVVAVVSSGFRAVAKTLDHMQAVRAAAKAGTSIRLVTAPSAKPGMMPTIVDVQAGVATR